MSSEPPFSSPIYLASIALEPNRWKRGHERVPSLLVSEWSERARAAGFDGWEIWEDHYFKADEDERRALCAGKLPIRVFNTYLRPGFEDESAWTRVVRALEQLGPQLEAIKFNLGDESVPAKAQIGAALWWAERLPESITMLCECHPGTIVEEPEAAARAFAVWPAPRFAAILHPFGGTEGHCARWFDALGARIRHIHWQGRDSDRKFCSLDSYPERFRAVRDELRAQGFSGTQSIEFVDGTGRPGETVERLFEAAARDLRSLGAR